MDENHVCSNSKIYSSGHLFIRKKRDKVILVIKKIGTKALLNVFTPPCSHLMHMYLFFFTEASHTMTLGDKYSPTYELEFLE